MKVLNAHTATSDWRKHFERLEGAYAPSTMRSYRIDVEAFEAWCHENRFQAFPAPVDTVCRFLQDQGANKAPSTVRRRLYAIRKVHRLLQLEDPTYDEKINLALRRVRRAKPGRPKQAKGMTRAYLDRFLAGQPDTPLGLRNRAMLSLGYELLTRRSELVAIRVCDLEEREDGTLRILIRRAKNDPFGEGRIAFTSARTASLVADWLAWRGPEISPLFCPIYHRQPIDRVLSPDTVKRLVKEGTGLANLDPEEAREFSGHSMRVGAAQDLLRRGFDTAAIMRAGGWTSINVVSRYLAHAEHNVWE
jgi:site-specific recombinase XerD